MLGSLNPRLIFAGPWAKGPRAILGQIGLVQATKCDESEKRKVASWLWVGEVGSQVPYNPERV